MPKLERDEFNAYRKTLLQDYLYELIFRESQSTSSSPVLSPDFAMPSLGEENAMTSDLAQKLDTSLPTFIEDVCAQLPSQC